ncbi:hypothetical protein [Thermus tenuipuniceus]|uniref:hypothetical protein n=1 Tax=Thermus tenuipuniceus TaxID=2078690 RepID=UPI0013E3FC34|nr:hypothetical protein [Thermus tenuipuniceus]
MFTTRAFVKRVVFFLVALLALAAIIAGQVPLGFVGAFLLGVLLGMALDYALYGEVAWVASPREILFGAALAGLLFLALLLWKPVWITNILDSFLKEPAFLGFALTVILLGRPRRLWPGKGTQKG